MNIEIDLKELMKPYLFELNTSKLRRSLKAQAECVLEVYKLNDMLNDYTVSCNETNNAPKQVLQNQLRLDASVQFKEGEEFQHFNSVLGNINGI